MRHKPGARHRREKEMGWSTGFEPATARSTIWGSNQAELRPPLNRSAHYVEPVPGSRAGARAGPLANPLSTSDPQRVGHRTRRSPRASPSGSGKAPRTASDPTAGLSESRRGGPGHGLGPGPAWDGNLSPRLFGLGADPCDPSEAADQREVHLAGAPHGFEPGRDRVREPALQFHGAQHEIGDNAAAEKRSSPCCARPWSWATDDLILRVSPPPQIACRSTTPPHSEPPKSRRRLRQ